MLRTLGLFLSFLASSLICYFTTKYLIKEVKGKKEIEILGKDYKIAILGAISFMTALGAISIIPSLITATIAPDMYWLVELISK